jgi:uncharacterized membrane protein YkoI
MRTSFAGILAGAVLGACLSAGAVLGDEERIPLDKVPKAVREAVQARFPGAKLLGAEKEVENGKTQYEIAVKHEGKKIEATLTHEGKLLEFETRIAVKDMPRAVRRAIESKYRGGKYKAVEAVTKVREGNEKLEYYEVQIEAGKKKVEVLVTADGRIKKEEEKRLGKED